MKTLSFFFFLICLPFTNISAMEHYPYSSKECLSCHKKGSDGKPIKNVFIAAQPDLCYQCHERKDEGKNVHPALFGDCTDCHSPHESKNPALLKSPTAELCVNCHDAPGRDATNQHSALIMGKSCVRCHSAHSSNNEKLLIDKTPKLCIYCHTEIAKGLADPNNTIHVAVSMGCEQCHAPHGSENSKLLTQNPNALCFKCHAVNKFTSHPRTGHPTDGRPDPLYPDKKFTCISCHKPHFSPNPKLIRYNYTKPLYRGSVCNVCHWGNALPLPAPPRPPWE